jgi:hypothetical protein
MTPADAGKEKPMNSPKIAAAAVAAKPRPAMHPQGGLNKDFTVRRCIEATVLDYIEDPGFGDKVTGEDGKLTGTWTIDIARLVEILEGQITREEILEAIDQLVLEDKVMLWPGDGGISIEPLKHGR